MPLPPLVAPRLGVPEPDAAEETSIMVISGVLPLDDLGDDHVEKPPPPLVPWHWAPITPGLLRNVSAGLQRIQREES